MKIDLTEREILLLGALELHLKDHGNGSFYECTQTSCMTAKILNGYLGRTADVLFELDPQVQELLREFREGDSAGTLSDLYSLTKETPELPKV